MPTKAEQTILDMIADGKNPKDVAEKFGLSDSHAYAVIKRIHGKSWRDLKKKKDKLTSQDKQTILDMVANDKTPKEIADEIGFTLSNVYVAIKDIHGKSWRDLKKKNEELTTEEMQIVLEMVADGKTPKDVAEKFEIPISRAYAVIKELHGKSWMLIKKEKNN